MRSLLTTSKFLIILLMGIYASISYADWYGGKKPGISPVKFQQYDKICGGCHFPYQPGLLPAVSWEKIMSNIDNHFEQNLVLSPVESRTVTRYLLDNSAGRVNDDISYKILQSLKYDPVVIQITKTPYFLNMHSQLDDREKLKSLRQCDNCHQDAARGKY